MRKLKKRILFIFCFFNFLLCCSLTVFANGENKLESFPLDTRIEIGGVVASAFIAAYEDFSKKNYDLNGYKIYFYETSDEIKVTFSPQRLPGEMKRLGGRTAAGQSINYFYSKASAKIVRWNYQR